MNPYRLFPLGCKQRHFVGSLFTRKLWLRLKSVAKDVIMVVLSSVGSYAFAEEWCKNYMMVGLSSVESCGFA